MIFTFRQTPASRRNQCRVCPVALGINSVLRMGYYAEVGSSGFSICSGYGQMDDGTDSEIEYGGMLPFSLRDWIGDHDHFITGLLPITADLDIPERFLASRFPSYSLPEWLKAMCGPCSNFCLR